MKLIGFLITGFLFMSGNFIPAIIVLYLTLCIE